MRLKDFTTLSPQYVGDTKRGEVTFVPMEALRNGAIEQQSIPFSVGKSKYTYFADNDLLVAKVTPCFENGNIAVAKDLKQSIGFGSSEIFVLRPSKKVLSQYLYYLSQTNDFKDGACATMCGVGGLKRISPLFMRTYETSLPNLDEQNRIVTYLDSKTSVIDNQVSLLSKKRDAYLRLKKSVINRAVTKGLDSNVKFKDSGVEWIGEIPENWETRRIKDVCSSVFMGKTPVYTLDDNENYIIGQKNNQAYGLDFEGIKFADDEFYSQRSEYEFLQYSDVLLNTLGGGSVGRVGYFDYTGANKILTDGHLMVLRSKTYCTKFLYYYLSTKRTELENMAIGSTNQSFFNVSDIIILDVPYPTFTEQRSIAAYLDEKCSKIDSTIKNIDTQIEKYKLLKRALINEVVTEKRTV